jgi:large subunit ribosomal protein L19
MKELIMSKQDILRYVDNKFKKKEPRPFRVGDTIRVNARITEGGTTRIQVFEGTVLSIKGQGGGRNFTVRKISFGVGVERTYPLVSPAIEKITIVRSGHVRRAKLYFLRSRVGRAARLEEKAIKDVDSKPVPQTAKSENPSSENPPEKELVTAKPK